MKGYSITCMKNLINVAIYAPIQCTCSNTASDNKVWFERKVHQKEGSKNAGFPHFNFYTLNFETKTWKVYCLIELDSTLNLFSIIYCVFLGFGYKITKKCYFLLIIRYPLVHIDYIKLAIWQPQVWIPLLATRWVCISLARLLGWHALLLCRGPTRPLNDPWWHTHVHGTCRTISYSTCNDVLYTIVNTIYSYGKL